MLRAPSRRKRKEPVQKLNLIPILDAVFIFIFFLLTSASFIKIYEIQSDVPIISSAPPPSKKKPLALTLKITATGISVLQGVPSKTTQTFSKRSDGEYETEKLHNYLVSIKRRYKRERSVIFEPVVNVSYEVLVKIMDSVRILRRTDPSIYLKDRKNKLEIKVNELFDKIVFGNIQS
jgi:biopolymer transport protein ExbD